jgi:hypothetical protein
LTPDSGFLFLEDKMAIDYTVLKNDITNNSGNITDVSWNQSDEWLTDKYNEIGASGETVAEVSNVNMNLIMAEFVKSEIDSLSTDQKVLLSGITTREGINPTAALNILRSIFAAGTTTRSNLEALQNRPASRMEVLFGQTGSLLDIHIARRS